MREDLYEKIKELNDAGKYDDSYDIFIKNKSIQDCDEKYFHELYKVLFLKGEYLTAVKSLLCSLGLGTQRYMEYIVKLSSNQKTDDIEYAVMDSQLTRSMQMISRVFPWLKDAANKISPGIYVTDCMFLFCEEFRYKIVDYHIANWMYQIVQQNGQIDGKMKEMADNFCDFYLGKELGELDIAILSYKGFFQMQTEKAGKTILSIAQTTHQLHGHDLKKSNIGDLFGLF